MTPNLRDLFRCFQGVMPSIIATADAHGMPNATYVSQVYLVDDRHVALSCQFFNKTRRNLDVNPYVCAEVLDAATLQAYRLHLKFLRSEMSGPLFDTMAMRIEAIASHTGMAGVFRLIAADVFEIERIESVDGFLTDAPPDGEIEEISLDGIRTELRGVQIISDRINRAADLESLLDSVLDALDQYFGFHHVMVLLADPDGERLVTIASCGFGESGVGAEVLIGEGLIGAVARERRLLRISGLETSLRYGRAIRREAQQSGSAVKPEIPLPGLPDAQSALVIPLVVGDRLVGVLAAQSKLALRFGEWHEAYLELIGNQIALGIDRMQERAADEVHDTPEPRPMLAIAKKSAPTRTLVYYRNDDCVFIDDEYLVRNVPGRILWRLLREREERGRTDFTNRELRLDT
ncbi:MAG TPA: GAF domain-containing protein, partial [Thermoanaerobaculia bacterium]|nr:GAF domain-containing protein [Thermoanaerobaculia bacterium]